MGGDDIGKVLGDRVGEERRLGEELGFGGGAGGGGERVVRGTEGWGKRTVVGPLEWLCVNNPLFCSPTANFTPSPLSTSNPAPILLPSPRPPQPHRATLALNPFSILTIHFFVACPICALFTQGHRSG